MAKAPPKRAAPARISKGRTLAQDTFGAHLDQLKRHVDVEGQRGLRSLYMEARGELSGRLRSLGRGGKAEAAQLRAMIAQVDAVLGVLGAGLNKRLADVGKFAAELGAEHGVAEFKRLAQHFEGMAPVLDLDGARVFGGLVKGVDRSLVRRRSIAAETWSRSQALQIETRMRVGVATGKSIDALVDDIQGDLETDRWKAERIVRTESHYAAGASKQAAMEAMAEDTGRTLMKKLIEHVNDDRVGDDSIVIHGQTVPIGAPFSWKRKRGGGWSTEHFMHPPNRPNDRGQAIPWDLSWDEDELTRPLTMAQLRAAPPTRWRKHAGVDVPPGHRPGKPYP